MKFSFPVFIFLFFLSFSGNGQKLRVTVQNSEPKRFAITYIKPTVFDDPELIEGLELKDFMDNRCIQFKKNAKFGVAEEYFYYPSGKYNITVFYFDESNEKPTVKLIINDQPIGSILFGSGPDKGRPLPLLQHKIFSGINISKWSKIDLQFNGNGNEKCRIGKVIFARTGDDEGKIEDLPKTLEVFENAQDRLLGRSMLSDFVNGRIDSLMNERVKGFSSLKAPEEWVERQNETRQKLETFFGTFPKKTPLNAKITGKIDHEKYTIEKLYFESQLNYYVTANLYIPKNRQFPLPGVLFTCGHSDIGKESLLYQEACIGLADKGYVVLSFDPTGEGERIEYFNDSTRQQNVEGPVSQHYYLGRPSFLVNWTLSGLRLWDAIKALDYLVSRPEVDTSKIAAVGNSGGGQMALLITAVDNRVKVCAAGHPGGQMEKNYLPGQNLIDRQILSLIAPRPVRIIVGEKSGEAAFHLKKIEDIQLFNEGLGFNKDRAQLSVVDGVHDLKYPKREKVYEWLNRWFCKEAEGTTEPSMQTEDPKALWATKSGLTLVPPGGETGQTLNAKRLKEIYKPAGNAGELKKRIARRIGIVQDTKKHYPDPKFIDTLQYNNISVEKLTYQSEEGIFIPSLLIKPQTVKAGSPVYIFASDRGKPTHFQDAAMPFLLAKKGFIVLAIDVRGVGETSPTPSLPLPVKYSSCTPFQWFHDRLAIESPGFGRTMLAMRTFDIIRGIDFLNSQKEFDGRKIVVYGKGLGGIWSLLASIYDSRISGVVTDGTLASYKQLVNNKYYKVPSAYFWVPGALCDFDIPDLARLADQKPQVWIDPINGLGEKLTFSNATSIIGFNKNRQIILAKNKSTIDFLHLFKNGQ